MSSVRVFGNSSALDSSALDGHRVVADERLGVSAELDASLAAAESFIILPQADPLLCLSLLVAKQYNKAFAHKTVAILHTPESPSPYVALTRRMQAAGVVPQAEDDLYTIVDSVAAMQTHLRASAADAQPALSSAVETITNHPNPHCLSRAARPAFNVCILGSYSTKDPAHIQTASEIGTMLHANGWGLVYGGSDKGMMKAFAEAACGADHSGYVKAVIPELYLWNGIAAELHSFINEIDVTSDIYVRMQHMAKQSDVFVAAPGGLGTAQEIAAFLRIKESDPTQKHKPLILLNGDGFWDDMIHVLEEAGYHQGTDFIAAQSMAQVQGILQHAVHAKPGIG